MYECSHYSDMMKDDRDTFNKFINEMLEKVESFKNFVKLFDEELVGVSLRFYELDGDDYGYPVAKWSVEFSGTLKNEICFSGYSIVNMYKLINNETNSVEFEGNYFELSDYINSDKFSHLTQEDLENLYRTEGYEYDKCKDWVGSINGFELSFNPDRYHG